MEPLNKMHVVTGRSRFSFKRFDLVPFHMMGHIVVESDSHLPQIFWRCRYCKISHDPNFLVYY